MKAYVINEGLRVWRLVLSSSSVSSVHVSTLSSSRRRTPTSCCCSRSCHRSDHDDLDPVHLDLCGDDHDRGEGGDRGDHPLWLLNLSHPMKSPQREGDFQKPTQARNINEQFL